MATPRADLSAIEEFHVPPFRLLRRKHRRWRADATHAPVVRVGVVQANRVLWDPRSPHFAPAVVLYTTDPRRCLDTAWVREVTDRVADLRDHRTGDPALDRVGELLDDEHSSFVEDVPPRLTGGVPARMLVTYIGREVLPGRAIPADGMLLGLGLEDDVRLLPASYY